MRITECLCFVLEFTNVLLQIEKKVRRYGNRGLRLAKQWQRRVKVFSVLMIGSVKRKFDVCIVFCFYAVLWELKSGLYQQ